VGWVRRAVSQLGLRRARLRRRRNRFLPCQAAPRDRRQHLSWEATSRLFRQLEAMAARSPTLGIDIRLATPGS
jgi:hypothetical protein